MEGISPAGPVHDAPVDLSSFSTALRMFRMEAQLTQEELAGRSGVSVRAISDLERGVKTRPQRSTVDLLAGGLGLDPAQRIEFEAAVPSRSRTGVQSSHSLDLPIGGFLGAVPESQLVARTSEIERVRTNVEAVKAGAGRLLLLTGEAGVGKTRLAQEATLICRANGMHLTVGQCYEPQQGVAYYPFLTIVSRLVEVAQSRLGIDPLQRWPPLRALNPREIQALDSNSGPLGTDGDHQSLFWSVAGLIEVVSEAIALVVALDDLHWADQSSLELLHHLAHQLRRAPVLLIGTYRDTEVGRRHPLRRVLRDLHREHLSEDIAVGRLSGDETRALMSSMLGSKSVSPGFVELVQRRTEGNAFFVQEIVRTLMERGEAFQDDGVWDYRSVDEIAIPRTVYEAIGERLSRLSESAQELLSEASVLGDSFEFDDLIAMGDRSEEEIERSLEEATRASVIRFGQGDSYGFYHALIQQVLYRDLSPRRRKRLHLAAGHAIEQQPVRVRDRRSAELAWHFAQGGMPDRALHYAVLAGDQAENRFAHRESERHYRTALNLAQSNNDPSLKPFILEKLGRVLTNYGRYEDARQLLEEAVPLFRQDADQAGEARVTVQLGSVYRAMGMSDTAIDRVQELLRRLDPDERPGDVAELYIVLETLCYTTGRYQDGLLAAERAAELSCRIGDSMSLARAETGRGSELIVLGRLGEGVRVLEGAIVIPGAEDDPYNLSRALENASQGYLSLGDVGRSLELNEQSLNLADRIHSPWDTAMALYSAGATYRMLGDWDQARACLEKSDKLRRDLASSWWAIYGILELSAFRLDEGHLDQASSLADEGLILARRARHLEGIRAGELLLSEIDLLQGRPQVARNRLTPLLDRPGLEELQVTEMLPTLAAAYEACGDQQQAEEVVEEAIRRARASNAMIALASALVLRGRWMAAQGNLDTAERDLDEAVGLARDMPYPHFEARGLFEWGVVCQRAGDLERARERFTKALEILQRLGARTFVERTKQRLSDLSSSFETE